MAAVAATEIIAVVVPLILPYITKYFQKRGQMVEQVGLEKEVSRELTEKLTRLSPYELKQIEGYIEKLKLEGIPTYDWIKMLIAKFPHLSDAIISIVSGVNAQDELMEEFRVGKRYEEVEEREVEREVYFTEQGAILGALSDVGKAGSTAGALAGYIRRWKVYFYDKNGKLVKTEIYNNRLQVSDAALAWKIQEEGNTSKYEETFSSQQEATPELVKGMSHVTLLDMIEKAHSDENDAVNFYTSIIEQAKRQGGSMGGVIAEKFTEIRKDEMDHRKIIQALYELMTSTQGELK